MSWIRSITVKDGLEEENTNRIVSFIDGDTMIQLSGYFTFLEIHALACFVRDRVPQFLIEQ
jgi:hypothetical protein